MLFQIWKNRKKSKSPKSLQSLESLDNIMFLNVEKLNKVKITSITFLERKNKIKGHNHLNHFNHLNHSITLCIKSNSPGTSGSLGMKQGTTCITMPDTKRRKSKPLKSPNHSNHNHIIEKGSRDGSCLITSHYWIQSRELSLYLIK